MQIWAAVHIYIYILEVGLISLETRVEHVCNISNRAFQKFPLVFRQCRHVTKYIYFVTLLE